MHQLEKELIVHSCDCLILCCLNKLSNRLTTWGLENPNPTTWYTSGLLSTFQLTRKIFNRNYVVSDPLVLASKIFVMFLVFMHGLC